MRTFKVTTINGSEYMLYKFQGWEAGSAIKLPTGEVYPLLSVLQLRVGEPMEVKFFGFTDADKHRVNPEPHECRLSTSLAQNIVEL